MKSTAGADDFDVPKHFWWAQGEAALKQNWATGDFETWIDQKIRLRAYGVKFMRDDILAMVEPKGGTELAQEPSAVENQEALIEPVAKASDAATRSGRPPDERWEDVLIEIFGQLLEGKLIPKRQADIQRAILDYAATIDFLPSESSAKSRARKIFKRWEKIGQEVPGT